MAVKPARRDDMDQYIDVGHPGCLCPLCDEPVLVGEECVCVVAHGTYWLVHNDCLSDTEDGDANDE